MYYFAFRLRKDTCKSLRDLQKSKSRSPGIVVHSVGADIKRWNSSLFLDDSGDGVKVHSDYIGNGRIGDGNKRRRIDAGRLRDIPDQLLVISQHGVRIIEA